MKRLNQKRPNPAFQCDGTLDRRPAYCRAGGEPRRRFLILVVSHSSASTVRVLTLPYISQLRSTPNLPYEYYLLFIIDLIY
jgi:hypothetical protein